MPRFNLSTNVNLAGIDDISAFLSEATTTIASLTGKPEASFMVVLKGSVPMSCGGTDHPTAYAELVSVGDLSPDVHKKLTAALSDLLQTKLNVAKDRFLLKLYDSHGSNFGFNGTTLA